MEKELAKSYEPSGVEKKWYDIWMQCGAFQPENQPQNQFKNHSKKNLEQQSVKEKGREQKDSFSIVIPPPNVTGVLHMGHALNSTLQDILVRYHRMVGIPTLWIPGMDHAGIATQSVVERKLDKEKIDKYQLGRDEFIRRVWQWKEEHGGIIQQQIKEMGHSPDWSKESFTLDENLSRAVRRVFVTLYKEGLIYRGERIINWCPQLRTALSDEEVIHKEINGGLYYIQYPVVGSEEKVVIATTRPETMLGDTAIAFHPEDERYQHLTGKKARLPLIGREIPFIADDYIDPEFGTGLVKVTPAHDPNDFDMAKRHGLIEINILDERGYINENGGVYQGMYRFAAREKIIADLETEGLFLKKENHTHAVGHCYRTNDVVEPYLTKQWFVKMKPLAEPAIEAVQTGDIRFVPENWSKTYLHWMENIRDWCISRQLWWGHRIPAWYCSQCGHITVSEVDVSHCEKCGSADIKQDEDVLDTWFSSALWPFSTMGWPENTETLKQFYPTSVLVTAFDIIFFWVARMIMMGIHFMQEVPFRDVLIHGLVLDEYGQKQSKSKGNVVNPLEMMYKYGTDAFRFTIAVSSAQGRGVRWNENNVSAYRHFANKIWNAARFIFMHASNSRFMDAQVVSLPPVEQMDDFSLWIVSRLYQTIERITDNLDAYRIGEAASNVYDFFWKEFCDWYIELSKDRLAQDDQRDVSLQVLLFVLKQGLKLLHPFMPFITEEIYAYIQEHAPAEQLRPEKLLIIAEWPDKEELAPYIQREASERVALFMDMVYRIRNLRGEMGINPGEKLEAIVIPDKTEEVRYQKIVSLYTSAFLSQGKLSKIVVDSQYTVQKTDGRIAIGGANIAIPLARILDLNKERERLERELSKVQKELDRLANKLNNPEFVTNAPVEIVEKEKEKMEMQKDLQIRYQNVLQSLS